MGKIKSTIQANWRFELVSGNKTIDVTNKLNKYIDPNNVLTINQDFNYGNLINKRFLNDSFYLKIRKLSDKKWSPITVKQNTPLKINLGKIKEDFFKIKIVYFFNADISECYLKLLKDQLNDLKSSKILEKKFTEFHPVIICTSMIKKRQIEILFNNLIKNKSLNYKITFSNNKYKEYEGINKVWELSNLNKTKLNYIFYFHGKGISYLQNNLFYIRQPLERFLFKKLINQWQKNIELLIRFESINKLGILSGGNGWLWFNFWIAKSTYLSNLEKPFQRNRACYYEDWLGRYIINESKEPKGQKNIYINEFNDKYYETLDETFSLLSNTKKLKFNIGTNCSVGKGGFVGLGIRKLTYRIWYYFYVILSKLFLIKKNNERFKFF